MFTRLNLGGTLEISKGVQRFPSTAFRHLGEQAPEDFPLNRQRKKGFKAEVSKAWLSEDAASVLEAGVYFSRRCWCVQTGQRLGPCAPSAPLTDTGVL